jgi:hypothetical protein
MARHRRSRVPWLRLRRSYRALWLQYQGLLKEYETLRGELELVLEPPPPEARQTAWGRANEDILETQLIPVITEVPPGDPPLDPDKAFALIRNTGMLDGPGGWLGRKPGRTG